MAVLWWLPTLALAALDLATFWLRARVALWAVRVLMEHGDIDVAERLLSRSRAAVERYGQSRDWR